MSRYPQAEPERPLPGLGHALVAGVALLAIAGLLAGAVYLAFVLLTAMAHYVPSQLP